MQDIIISSKTVKNRDDLFKLIKDSLPLPDYCGNNLDALHDCLTDLKEDFKIELVKDKALSKTLGIALIDGLTAMLSDTAKENPHMKLLFTDKTVANKPIISFFKTLFGK